MILTFLSSIFLIAYLIIRHLLSGSGIRYLVDSYGLDARKLKGLKRSDIQALRKQINQLRKKNDDYGLAELVKKFRP